MAKSRLTPKQLVQFANPNARLDYHESLRAGGYACFFIRDGLQGGYYTPICRTPSEAWRLAFDGLRASFKHYAGSADARGGKAAA